MCKDWKGGGAPGAFPFRAVIFDMDGVLVDTEVYTSTVAGSSSRNLAWRCPVRSCSNSWVPR